jgi:hypothetical protein
VADVITDLPELRRLGFPTDVYIRDYDYDDAIITLDGRALQAFFSAFPKLRELEIISSEEVNTISMSGISRSVDAHLRFLLGQFSSGIWSLKAPLQTHDAAQGQAVLQ